MCCTKDSHSFSLSASMKSSPSSPFCFCFSARVASRRCFWTTASARALVRPIQIICRRTHSVALKFAKKVPPAPPKLHMLVTLPPIVTATPTRLNTGSRAAATPKTAVPAAVMSVAREYQAHDNHVISLQKASKTKAISKSKENNDWLNKIK